MPSQFEIETFIGSSFRSVWSLDLVQFLYANSQTSHSKEQLIAALRASDAVVSQSIASLAAVGLVVGRPRSGSNSYRRQAGAGTDRRRHQALREEPRQGPPPDHLRRFAGTSPRSPTPSAFARISNASARTHARVSAVLPDQRDLRAAAGTQLRPDRGPACCCGARSASASLRWPTYS